MQDNIIAVNIPNAVSIIVMAIIGFTLLSLAGKGLAGRGKSGLVGA